MNDKSCGLMVCLVCACLWGCASDPVEEVDYSTVVVDGIAPPPPVDSRHGASHFQDFIQPGIRVARFDSEYALVNGTHGSRSGESTSLSGNGLGGSDSPVSLASSGRENAAAADSLGGGCDCSRVGEVFFALNSNELTPDALKILNEMPVSDKNLEVIGYADAIGSTTRNMTLARERADAVAAVLKSRARAVRVKGWFESSYEGDEFRKVIVVGLPR